MMPHHKKNRMQQYLYFKLLESVKKSSFANNGMSVCNSEFGSEFDYSAPSNAHSNSLLSALIPTRAFGSTCSTMHTQILSVID